MFFILAVNDLPILGLERLVVLDFSVEVQVVQRLARGKRLRGAGREQENAGSQQDASENVVVCHETHPNDARA